MTANGQIESNVRSRAVDWASSPCSYMRFHFSSFEATQQFTSKFLLKLRLLMHSSNEKNQSPNKSKALSYF